MWSCDRTAHQGWPNHRPRSTSRSETMAKSIYHTLFLCKINCFVDFDTLGRSLPIKVWSSLPYAVSSLRTVHVVVILWSPVRGKGGNARALIIELRDLWQEKRWRERERTSHGDTRPTGRETHRSDGRGCGVAKKACEHACGGVGGVADEQCVRFRLVVCVDAPRRQGRSQDLI